MSWRPGRRRFLELAATAAGALLAGQAGIALAGSGATWRVTNDAGVWWLIRPNGERTVSLGVNHVDPRLWVMPYNRQHTVGLYGADFSERGGRVNARSAGARRWMGRVLDNLAGWGFNTLGFHTPVPSALFADRIAWMATVRPITLTSYLPALEYVDVFAPEVAARLDAGVREVCEASRGEPNLLGYVYSDRPMYGVGANPRRQGGTNPWVATLQQQPSGSPGKRTWIGVLAQRYGTPPLAAAAQGVSASSWDALGAITSWPEASPGSPAEADQLVFLALVVERWYQLQFEAVRRHDPAHLIFGDKLGGGKAEVGYRGGNHPAIPEYLYPILKRYVDVVSVEWYGQIEDQVTALRAIHAATGKPILLGDSSFAEVQPEQGGKSKGVIVRSQAEVGDAFARYLEGAMVEPYIVGWHFCGYIESFTAQNDRFQPQNGFIDPFEKVHQEAVSKVKAANGKAVRWHEAALPR